MGRRWPLVAAILAALAVLLAGASLRAQRRAPGGAAASPPVAAASSFGPVSEGGEREQQLAQGVTREPESARAHEQLGTYYVEAGRPFEGLWELQEARRLDPNDLATGLSIAAALEAGRFPDEAVAELRALLARHPGRVEICRQLAEIDLATGRPESAAAVLKRAETLHRSPEALLALGRAQQMLKEYPAAERCFKEAQQLRPTRAVAPYRLGRLALDRGNTAAAEAAFGAARVLAPSNPEPRYELGLTYLRRGRPGDPAKAEIEFREAVRLAPEHPAAQRELGQLCLESGRAREAAEHFVQALRAARDTEACRGMALALAGMGRKVESQYHWGLYYMRKDLRPRSAAAFRQMAALDPKRREAVLLLTETYFRMKQEQRGIRLVEAALEEHPQDIALHERLAALYVAAGNRKATERVCREWLRIQPDAAAPHWILGKSAVDRLSVEEGVRELELARQRDVKNPEYAYALATALLRRPNPESQQRAVALLEEAIRTAPAVARYLGQMGLVLQQRGDLEGARRNFLASLNRDSHEAPVYSSLVAVARRERRPHQVRFWSPLVRAVEDRTREEMRLWRAVWDRPSDVAAYAELARFLVRTGELSKAESQLEEALRLRPRWPEAAQTLETVRSVLRVQSG